MEPARDFERYAVIAALVLLVIACYLVLTMSKMRLLATVPLIVALCSTLLPAQSAPEGGEAAEATLDVLVNAIRANRKALVGVNLGLTVECEIHATRRGCARPGFDRGRTGPTRFGSQRRILPRPARASQRR